MPQHSIASVISFCTNDYRFLQECVDNARLFSKQIIISVSDHFFNEEEENFSLLERIYKQFNDCLFVEFAFNSEKPYGKLTPLDTDCPDFVHHWHNSARQIPFYFLAHEIDYVIFFDSDEIADGKKIAEWLNGFNYQEFSALRFASYWYFREAKYQATTMADTALMVKKAVWNPI